jgi:hypothetical protein
MFLWSHGRSKDGKDHAYRSLVETVRTPDGPRQRTLCYLGELNSGAQARWLKTIEVFKGSFTETNHLPTWNDAELSEMMRKTAGVFGVRACEPAAYA